MKNFILIFALLSATTAFSADPNHIRPDAQIQFDKNSWLHEIYPDYIQPTDKDLKKMPDKIAKSEYTLADLIKFENSKTLEMARNFEFGLGVEKKSV